MGSYLKTEDIELTEITNTSALVVAKKDGSYLLTDQVQIYYQVYNPNIGVIINEYQLTVSNYIYKGININDSFALLVGQGIMKFDISKKEVTRVEQTKEINDYIYSIV
ncbi:hypothetical protein P344_04105 [Spiroplasma mirum ATCC 29335]|uniref:Uncharacterized protein n=1 Tax=Spiroplasma mirum ATCC 29335 TaxID=838561 RepID=W0GPV7_9MOLU|nr:MULTISPECIES: hypothetical protein [Spiroplasma]AHF61103.1 hypothetical protein SMM_0685 [Spiroplasma mirum ATCC 29335]AHI58149.1 hypothetical protein P344_04105 [Spiroplasma mirum ATCC 29335]AKM53201.1 hypothetical protein SATRI_v1c07490 [Spiroplasma atrichopogonis]